MPKRKRSQRLLYHSYSEQQLSGLRAHAQIKKQSTMDWLRSAIISLQAQHKPISTRTIYEECGLIYMRFESIRGILRQDTLQKANGTNSFTEGV